MRWNERFLWIFCGLSAIFVIALFYSARSDKDEAACCGQHGNALLSQGWIGEALDEYHRAMELDPKHPGAYNNMAWILATCGDVHFRNGPLALNYAKHAYALSPDDPVILDTLAAAYAETGNLPLAIRVAEKAVAIAEKAGDRTLAEQIRKRLELYRQGKPYREPVK